MTHRHLKTRFALAGMVVIFAMVVPHPVGAQQLPISCGQTVAGGIATTGEVDSFTFTGTAQAVVHIGIGGSGTSSNFVPCWQLVGPTGPVGDLACRTRAERALPAGGPYRIDVRDNNQSETGTYSISLEFVSGPQSCGGVVPCGGDLEGDVGDGAGRVGDVDAFRFTGAPDDIVTIAIGGSGTSSNFTPCWLLFAHDGTPVGGSTPVCRARAKRVLDAAGTYTILVFDDNQSEVGSYGGALDAVSASASCGAEVPCGGDVRNVTIGPTGDADSFRFPGVTGDLVSIGIGGAGTSSNFAPCFQLYDPDGEEVGPVTCRDHAELPLAKTGAHTILTFDNNQSEPGTYSVAVEVLAGQPACGAGLNCGSTQPAAIESLGDIDAYGFVPTSDGTVTIGIGGSGPSSNFLPCWRLFGAEGAIGERVCRDADFRNVTAGMRYRILAFDDNQSETGTYSVSLQGFCIGSPTTTTTTTSSTSSTSSTSTTSTSASTSSSTSITSSASTSTTSTSIPFGCGNGVVDAGEECDPAGCTRLGEVCDGSCHCVASPNGCPRLTIPAGVAYAGGRIALPVILTPGPFGVGALNFEAHYESGFAAGAHLDACLPGSSTVAARAEQTCQIAEPPGAVTVAVVNRPVVPVPALAAGPVTELVFAIPALATGQHDVCLALDTVRFGSVTGPDTCVETETPVCGRVTVNGSCSMQGDCNCDGRVNSGDRVCLVTKFFDPSQQGSCPCEDCNLSGEMNAADAPCITLCAFGECPPTSPQP